MHGTLKRPSSLSLFGEAPFRALFFGNLGNAFGIELRLMAQSWLILELGGSQFWVGAANGLRIIPAIVLTLMAGVLVDRIGGRAVLLVERGLLLGLAALTALVVMADATEVWHVVVLSVAAGAMISLGLPSMQTMVRFVVPSESLQAANSLNQLTFSSARALGPLGGGFLLAAFGLGSPWLALIGIYALTVFWTLRLPKHEPAEEPSTASAVSQIREGIAYIRGNPVLTRIILISFQGILTGSFVPIIPIYARERFNIGETGYGIMLAAFAAGQAFAAIVIVLKGGWDRKVVVMTVGILIATPSIGIFGYSQYLWLSMVALFGIGVAFPLWITSVATLLQTQTERAMLGRVMSVYALSIQTFFFGALTGAWIGQLIGNDLMLLLGGLIAMVFQLSLIITSPQLRRL